MLGPSLTNAILIAGISLVIMLAVLMVRGPWRLPSLMFGSLAIPGNVDDLLPQMRLDPNDLANNTAPAVSVLDLLVVWAILLTLRESRSTRIGSRLLGLAGILAAIACTVAAVAVVRGVEPAAAARGAIVFLRIVAVLYLAGNLVNVRGDAFRLAVGTAGGGAILLANGLYTSTITAQERFTASTFGRNTFAIALVIVAIASASIVFGLWSRRRENGRNTAVVVGSSLVGIAAMFGAVATGTRMSLIALVGASVLALLLNQGWRSRDGLVRVGVIAIVTIGVIGAATLFSPGGSRTISIFTTPGDTIDAVTDPGSQPIYSEIRSRSDFWNLAGQMAMEHPLAGVGPFQWNFERYRYAEFEPLVADPHNGYLQTAAEYGLPVAGLYILLLGSCMVTIVLSSRDRAALTRTDTAVVVLTGAGLAFVLSDLTNSNLFNVRMGLIGWLLIAVAVAYATMPNRDIEADPESAVAG